MIDSITNSITLFMSMFLFCFFTTHANKVINKQIFFERGIKTEKNKNREKKEKEREADGKKES